MIIHTQFEEMRAVQSKGTVLFYALRERRGKV